MPVDWKKDAKLFRAAARYTAGGVLLGDAAREAGVTTVELMDYLVRGGYQSSYSFDEFNRAQSQLDEFRDYTPPRRRGKA